MAPTRLIRNRLRNSVNITEAQWRSPDSNFLPDSGTHWLAGESSLLMPGER